MVEVEVDGYDLWKCKHAVWRNPVSIYQLVLRLIGRHGTYRLGRMLYMRARGDIPNNMASNGELMVQRCMINAFRQSRDEKFVCFDVGANVGDWSLALLSACQSVGLISYDIYLFEPVPSTFDALRNRIGTDGRIHYEQLALSSADGSKAMNVVGELAGTNSLHTGNAGSSGTSIMVDTISASQFSSIHGIDVIHLLKCDTEGHDMNVIEGALPLLRNGKVAVLQFEYNHRWIFSRYFLKDVFDAVEGLPYRVGKVCPDHVEVYERWYPEHDRYFEANYILIRMDALSWFDIREIALDNHCTLAGMKP